MTDNLKGQLYIIATPIGNLGDFSFRAVQVLQSVDLILCEDTRVSKKLLDAYNIQTPTLSYHQHSDGEKIRLISNKISAGQNLALITDAGTPGISDPGNLLISHLLKADPNCPIIPIPGPCAAIVALSVSGFPTDKFLFLGFPPHKNKRQKFFKELAVNQYTTVFYESCHRLKKCLRELTEVLSSDRQIMIARELTKKFETVYRGNITEMMKADIKEKGEFVIVINSYAKK
ncbi:MAG: 16S rRNA (cytidine(1402)-2'-O)-methyltransferase [Candidatus Magasanikbacteria bacterium CG10_big_fil_rev_8_21_14_0_10_40_10]|uniref:Ribosomal RNA small subunit methyltransferase I n=1 Tax=Candidatus Magasanikbacteria bacterium CG10_big_fil_rev_8_21_14_0_10_40_10 TaxID=1974648 RepID=A0A2M6W4W5_9BACT|nr:MAG: 16S rRNA (cytidine(1402)-2'-O)-methyltransferase [Candidatus Magasanikbacteria bacterium CG10_big_fil_rev_8_21_14_0_10_40_10]